MSLTKSRIDDRLWWALVLLVVALVVYGAFWTTGYYAGALKGVLLVMLVSNTYILLAVFYRRGRKTMNRGQALLNALKQLFHEWKAFLLSINKTKSRKER